MAVGIGDHSNLNWLPPSNALMQMLSWALLTIFLGVLHLSPALDFLLPVLLACIGSRRLLSRFGGTSLIGS